MKYKLVPVEPTPEMIHAGQMAVSGFPRDVLERWEAMLAAAPDLDRQVIAEVEAPSNSLPSWSECNLRVGNSEWLKDNDREAECDSLTANPLHEFIHEYDDSDAYKSAWFLHRLENLIGFIRSEQQPAPDAALVEALESAKNLIANHSGETLPISYAGDQIEQIDAAITTYRKQGGSK